MLHKLTVCLSLTQKPDASNGGQNAPLHRLWQQQTAMTVHCQGLVPCRMISGELVVSGCFDA